MASLALTRAALLGTMGLLAAHASVYRPHFSRAEFGKSECNEALWSKISFSLFLSEVHDD
jgi:hypothetical protein